MSKVKDARKGWDGCSNIASQPVLLPYVVVPVVEDDPVIGGSTKLPERGTCNNHMNTTDSHTRRTTEENDESHCSEHRQMYY